MKLTDLKYIIFGLPKVYTEMVAALYPLENSWTILFSHQYMADPVTPHAHQNLVLPF